MLSNAFVVSEFLEIMYIPDINKWAIILKNLKIPMWQKVQSYLTLLVKILIIQNTKPNLKMIKLSINHLG